MAWDESAALLGAIATPVVWIGADRRIRVINAHAAAVLGSDLAGRHYQTAMRQPDLVAAIERALDGGGTGSARHVLPGLSSDGVYRVTVAPIARDGVMCTFVDVSEAERIVPMRREFVANVSHELRTPLTALLGFIETLQGAARDDPAARARFLGIMAQEAGRMNRLVGDLLSLSRVEAEERLRPTALTDMAGVVGRAVDTLRPMADAAGIALTVDGAGASVPADADQMMQVVSNLVENAVKYGGAGKSVAVSMWEAPRDPFLRAPALLIAVQDRGAGIDPVHLPRLTERFYRIDAHRSRERGGTGLGLAIVKHIVNRHRGHLRIESVVGQGSTFTVALPKAET